MNGAGVKAKWVRLAECAGPTIRLLFGLFFVLLSLAIAGQFVVSRGHTEALHSVSATLLSQTELPRVRGSHHGCAITYEFTLPTGQTQQGSYDSIDGSWYQAEIGTRFAVEYSASDPSASAPRGEPVSWTYVWGSALLTFAIFVQGVIWIGAFLRRDADLGSTRNLPKKV